MTQFATEGTIMNLRSIERRQDHRTNTFTPISLLVEGHEAETPAHLLDLSATGAAVLMTARSAPVLGEHLSVHFETPNNDGGAETTHRIETGIVVNSSMPERGIRRVGIRFLRTPDIGSGLFNPTDLLSSHRKSMDKSCFSGKWQTARHFREPSTAGMTRLDLHAYPW